MARRWVRRHGLDVALALPLFACVLLFTVASVLDTVCLSLTAAFGVLPSIASYRAILATEVFRTATLNTVVVALLSLASSSAWASGSPSTSTPASRCAGWSGRSCRLVVTPLGGGQFAFGVVRRARKWAASGEEGRLSGSWPCTAQEG